MMDAAKFHSYVTAEAAKWLEENVDADTRAVFIATDRGHQWWTYSPHVYDKSALSNLRGFCSSRLGA